MVVVMQPIFLFLSYEDFEWITYEDIKRLQYASHATRDHNQITIISLKFIFHRICPVSSERFHNEHIFRLTKMTWSSVLYQISSTFHQLTGHPFYFLSTHDYIYWKWLSGTSFRFKIKYGGNLLLSAVTYDITVNRCFTYPVVSIFTSFAPLECIV